MNTIPTKLNQAKSRQVNKPWKDDEKGIHLKNYENSLKWPVGRPTTLQEYLDKVKNV